MLKWEYRYVYSRSQIGKEDDAEAYISSPGTERNKIQGDDARFINILSNLGEEGWEAVGYTAQGFSAIKDGEGVIKEPGGVVFTALIKRPKQLLMSTEENSKVFEKSPDITGRLDELAELSPELAELIDEFKLSPVVRKIISSEQAE